MEPERSDATEGDVMSLAPILRFQGVLVPALSALALAASQPAAAQDAGQSDAICADRPGKVFATCVLDTGKFQVESDLADGTFQRQGGVTTDTYVVATPTLKYGLAKDLDIEASLTPYEVVRTHDKFGDERVIGGVGDLFLRAKYAAYAAPDGKLTVTLLPYVKAPIAREGIGNGEVEGGAAVAIGYKFNDDWSLSLSPELDAYADEEGSGRHLNHVEVISLSRSLPHQITVSGELWGDWEYDPSGTTRQYSADISAAWAMTKTLQFDGGLNLGLNRETPGAQVYIGVSKRF